ncbi:transcriptional regulator, TetR family [Stenotrophomonas indicatrix]|uniref:Transcriptional regulator, TetR family n=2 Tax=Stenotrophomonas indicatrix TaxID=2045451 RepID=A0A1W1GZW0_9GAMM|nr:transcriptional regulator, TetR family [Stenotrophomonas indicatrix]
MPISSTPTPPRRGRPPKPGRGFEDTRGEMIRVGLELLTERSFSATGVDAVVKSLGVPKGSFYHYFDSKEAYGLAVLQAYDAYFCRKLDRHLLDAARDPLDRIVAFMADACNGLQRFQFRRGCLVGNLGQEVGTLPIAFRDCLLSVFNGWELRLANCLRLAQARGDLSSAADCKAIASYFWIGWEGAVLRARLEGGVAPLQIFSQCFIAGLPR